MHKGTYNKDFTNPLKRSNLSFSPIGLFFNSFPPSAQGKKGNFEMYHDGDFFGLPYDYYSVMHYLFAFVFVFFF